MQREKGRLGHDQRARGRGERVDREPPQAGRTVDQQQVVVTRRSRVRCPGRTRLRCGARCPPDRKHRSAGARSSPQSVGLTALRSGQLRCADDHVGRSVAISRASTEVADAWGSRSTSSTRFPRRAAAAAKDKRDRGLSDAALLVDNGVAVRRPKAAGAARARGNGVRPRGDAGMAGSAPSREQSHRAPPSAHRSPADEHERAGREPGVR